MYITVKTAPCLRINALFAARYVVYFKPAEKWDYFLAHIGTYTY